VACFLVVRQVRSGRSVPAAVPQIRRYRPDQPWASGADSARGGRAGAAVAVRGPKVPGRAGHWTLPASAGGRHGGPWRYRHQSDCVLPGLAGTGRDRQEEQVLRWLASGLAAW